MDETVEALMRRCREIGLARMREVGPVDMAAMPDWFLRVGTGWSTRCTDSEGRARLEYWRSLSDDRAKVDGTDGLVADQIGRCFGSPSGDRTQHHSPERVAAADETAVSTRQLQPPSSFTASVELGEEATQGQLFDPATTGLA